MKIYFKTFQILKIIILRIILRKLQNSKRNSKNKTILRIRVLVNTGPVFFFGMYCRVVDILRNLKKKSAAVVRLPCVQLAESAMLVYFCPKVLALLLVKGALLQPYYCPIHSKYLLAVKVE